jgi:4,5-dihydroxyphthalate decarboxylase
VPGAVFDFCGPKSPPAGFKDMVRRGAYDLGELALGTYLQALTFGKPLVLLPVTIMARLQHGNLVCRSAGRFAPGELAGKRVGVRSYSQTTGIWVRSLLEETYGVAARDVTWVCTEDPHLAEYVDPTNVERIDVPSDQIATLLAAGQVDAAIFGADLPKNDPEVVPVIPEPNLAAFAWYERHQYVPINHMLAVTQDFAERHPELVRAIYALFVEAAAAAPVGADGIDFFPHGFDAVRAPVEAMIEHAVNQQIIPHRFTFDEVFAPSRRLLVA